MSGAVVLVLRLLATAALYAFLGFALWTMWQEIRRSASQPGGATAPPIRLEVKARGEAPVTSVFVQPQIILGRDPISDLPLIDTAASARHALLSYHDGQWWLEDLGSRNGTRLNRDRLGGPTVLTTGDEIKCGNTKVIVTLPSRGETSGGGRQMKDE